MELQVAKPSVPVAHWIVAGLSAVWNAFGAYDYVMTRSGNIDYLDGATRGQGAAFLAWLDGTGIGVQVAWPLGVWASVAGAILLLVRSRHAVTAFAVSLVGAVISMGLEHLQGIPAAFDSGAMRAMEALVIAVIVAQWWYARRAIARGVLA